MATWEEFKKKMFKKNKNFEKDFKEIERRMMNREVLFYLLFSIIITVLVVLNSFLCAYILVTYSW